MADVTDPDSPHDPSSPERDPDWYIQKWNALCDEFGTSDPSEVMARVQTLKRQMNRPDEEDDSEGLVTISEVEEVFREMNRKMDKLRERNAALADRLEDDEETNGAFRDLHRKTEQLLETLDATTMDEARKRIRTLNERLEDLYREKEALVQAGLSGAQEAVDELNRLREEREALRRERDQLEAERKQGDDDLDASSDDADASSSADPDTSVLEAAVVIREQIGVSTPDQAEAFTQIAKQTYDRLRQRAAAYDAEVEDAPTDVVEMLHSMAVQLDSLPAPGTLPPAAADILGVTTASEARTLATTVRRLGDRLTEHYDSSVEFDEEALEANDVVSLLHRLEDQVRVLPEPGAPSQSGDALPSEAGDILGIRTVEEAKELEALIHDMSEQLERLQREHKPLEEADLSAEGALAMIENMEAQLVDLYQKVEYDSNGTSPVAPNGSRLDDALLHRIVNLTGTSPETADDVTEVLHTLVDQLDEQIAKVKPLTDAGLDAEEAVTLIESMEAQLNDLYREKEKEGDAAGSLAAINEVLGISTREEAEELSQLARQMEDQLSSLYREKKKLNDLGLASIEDAVDMIESMEAQLADLYEDKEGLRNIQRGRPESQSTFEQLKALYAEQQKLQEALGVSAADEVIEMVESLNSQLDDLYTARDAEVDPEERHDALLWAPEPDASPSQDRGESTEPSTRDEVDTLTMNSMEHQLEALYREKETLLHHGFNSAQAAVDQLQTQQKQIDALQRENHTYEQRFDRLKSELGTESVPKLVELIRTLESEADESIDELLPSSSSRSESTEYGVDIEATSPFVSEETLQRLDSMEPAELDDLDVGVIRLGTEGTVEYLNDRALQLPGLHAVEDPTDVVGDNFFLDLAPSTNNNLFFGRFQKGQRRGEMNARFPYTFISPDEGPQSFAVHLYRTPDGEATWLLFRPS